MVQQKLFDVRSKHPCFGNPNNSGRIHLPVCPSCNIRCKFCDRSHRDESGRDIPGLAAGLIRPEDAPDYVTRALDICPFITVVGVAGPGDALATDHALRALKAVHEHRPNLIKCMSTNGLMLPTRMSEVIAAGVTTLTVTVNAVDPAILARINGGIVVEKNYLTGESAQEILIAKQLEGISLASAAGILVKVNTVLAPGINGAHIQDVARAAAGRGAAIFNIIPLIAQRGMSNEREPTCEEVDAARAKIEKYLPVFRHCQHCRADAVGKIGGRNYAPLVFEERVEETFSHG